MGVTVTIQGEQRRIPVVQLDGKIYFILGGTYNFLHDEKRIQENYLASGEVDRQIQNTGKTRHKFNIIAPSTADLVDVQGASWDVGTRDDLHTSADKVPPYDWLEFYDISADQDFSGTYTHYVVMKIDWEVPYNNDPGIWQIPVELWGYAVP